MVTIKLDVIHALVLAYQFLGSYLGQTADKKKPMLGTGFILDVLD
ncbi:hypothetical protein ACMAZD_16995 [Vibrio sp. nBUS_14]